jgi:hypothetical protein
MTFTLEDVTYTLFKCRQGCHPRGFSSLDFSCEASIYILFEGSMYTEYDKNNITVSKVYNQCKNFTVT